MDATWAIPASMTKFSVFERFDVEALLAVRVMMFFMG